jgi:cytochrome b pre-mRNA-processing protein 3
MIWPLTSRKRRPDTISTLYGMIVAQARLPGFYRDYAVADTVNGRFDLIVLHLTLVLDRLSAEPALQGYGQGLFDRFCRDMDDNLREMGIGDLKVPKEMRRMGDAFYGRARAYRAAFAADDSAVVSAALAEALARNVYAGSTEAGEAAPRRLAAYMRRAVDDLKAQDAEMLAAGAMRFPDPSVISQQDGLKP